MRAEDYLQKGDLQQALSSLQEEVRNDPAKAELRVFLFQLLSVLGQWDRAITQLNVAADMDADALLLAQIYGPALNCEALRVDIFAGRRTPLIFGEPPEWVTGLLRVPVLLANGEIEGAAELRDQAFENAPEIAGSIDNEPFTWIADADSRLGPMLEAIVNGKYYWIPFERISAIRVEPPENLRDVVWTTASFTWSNQGEAVGLIPSRYPGSEKKEDSAFSMGRKTEWMDAGHGFYFGTGQRMLASDQNEYPLLEVREIQFQPTTG